MTSLKLKRPWFDGAAYHDAARHEVDSALVDRAPSDALVYGDNGELLGTAGELREAKIAASVAEPVLDLKVVQKPEPVKEPEPVAEPAKPALDLTKK